jgi:hypothetical protein
MQPRVKKIPVYLEAAPKRTFAGALEWPGWCRSGREEDSALQGLFEYAPRYARALEDSGMDFEPPEVISVFQVTERLQGNATTDFGAPAVAPDHDQGPVSATALERLEHILRACWHAFDLARRSAGGKELRKGPRGGGRELDAIAEHLLGSDQGYLAKIGWKLRLNDRDHLETRLDQTRQAILGALDAAAGGHLQAQGPRGGVFWTPRYFVRRVAWHVLDHAWEIEDRSL